MNKYKYNFYFRVSLVMGICIDKYYKMKTYKLDYRYTHKLNNSKAPFLVLFLDFLVWKRFEKYVFDT